MRVIGAINNYLVEAMLIAFVVWGICVLVSYIRNKKICIKNWTVQYVFITYLISVLLITEAYKVFIEGIPTYFMEPNLIPFINTVTDIFYNPENSLSLIGYNILLFVPFGFLVVPSFPNYQWNFWKVLLVTVIVVLFVEVMEYCSGRCLDVDDIFINTIGSIWGYYVYSFLSKKFVRKNSSCMEN